MAVCVFCFFYVYLKPKVTLQWLSIRFSECWLIAYKNYFIPIKDQSIAHMTTVLCVCFLRKGTIRP